VAASVQLKEVIMPQQRRFTAKFKTQIVLDLLTGAKTMAQICREHNLKDQVVRRWKADFLDRTETLFGGDADRQQHLDRIAELERLVGRLTMELEIAKKPPSTGSHRPAETGGDGRAAHRLSDRTHLLCAGLGPLDGVLSGRPTR
jgi:transposase